MWNKNKKIILGTISGLVLLIALGYQNCGQMHESNTSGVDSLKTGTLENSFSDGIVTLVLKDGTKIKMQSKEPTEQPKPVTLVLKDGTKIKLEPKK